LGKETKHVFLFFLWWKIEFLYMYRSNDNFNKPSLMQPSAVTNHYYRLEKTILMSCYNIGLRGNK